MKTVAPEITLLQRQRAKLLGWQQGHVDALFPQQQNPTSFFDCGSGGGLSSCFNESLLGLGEVLNHRKAIDPAPGIDCWAQLNVPGVGFDAGVSPGASSGYAVSCGSISRTASCPPPAAVMAAGGAPQPVAMPAVAEENTGPVVKKESFRKRKLDRAQSMKDDMIDKKSKGCSEEMASKITEQSGNGSINKETSPSTSKENSKASEVQKPDYIHVRARRGQATDSHSLAERVRREKISERMKFLQELVPGCNKITGKAGMLDEIINYVQSLQRQVEFLSMKLAAVNPRLDFEIESLFPKEIIPTCTSSFPTIDMSSELTHPTYLQFDPMQQALSCSGLEMGIMNPDIELQRTSAPLPIIDTSIESSCFPQTQPGQMWDTDFQNLYNYQPHQYLGQIEATNMKMEI